MKTLFSILLLSIALIGFNSCKKSGCTDPQADNYDYDANDNDGSCTYTGSVTFWMSTGSYYVDVTVNGSTKTISSNYASAPDCGTSGCANFTLPSGSYSYHAEEDTFFPAEWNGTITVPKGGCQLLQLTY